MEYPLLQAARREAQILMATSVVTLKIIFSIFKAAAAVF